MRRVFFVSFVLLSSGLGLPAARAQGPAPDVLDEEAHALFEAGSTAWRAGRYEAALEYFQRAYELSRRPQLLLNIAQAAERCRQDRLALASFRRFLEEVPESPRRVLAQTRVAFLERHLEESEEEAPPEPSSPGAPPEPSSSASAEAAPGSPAGAPASPARAAGSEGASDAGAGPGATPWMVAGIAAGAAVGGGLLLGLGLVDRAAVEDPEAGARWLDVEAAYQRGPALLVAGAIVAPVGVVAIVAAIVWGVAGGDGGSERALRLTPEGLGVEVAF